MKRKEEADLRAKLEAEHAKEIMESHWVDKKKEQTG